MQGILSSDLLNGRELLVTDQERANLLTLVNSHSSIILTGFPLVGLLRAVEATLQVREGQVSDALKMGLLQGNHPDFIIRDGRDFKLEELRELVQDATVSPVIWTKKYLTLYYLDHAYHSSYSTLLKLIEEPPAHLSVIICVGSTKKVPATILSRSLVFPVQGLDNTELSWWLDFKNKTDHRDLRLRACGGDPELAECADVTVLKDWSECWESFINGSGELSTSFLATWNDRFEGVSDLTQLGCWYVLGHLLNQKLTTHTLWLEMGSLAWRARHIVRAGEMNKQQTNIFLIKLYALARTVKNRTRVKVQ